MKKFNYFSGQKPVLKLSRPKILVIEDDPFLTEMLEELFTQSEYHFKILNDTEDILSLVADFEPDLVLLDYMLPNINGGELCGQIKNHEVYHNIPVIIYSAFPKVLLSLGDYGCDVFIEKPFELYELNSTIQKLATRHPWKAS